MIDHIHLCCNNDHWVVKDGLTGEDLYSSRSKESASMWAQRYVRYNGCVLHIHDENFDASSLQLS